MKHLFLTCFSIFSIVVYSQGCKEATKSGLYSVYQKYKDKGLKIIHKQSGIDYMEFLIDDFTSQIIDQMSIDANYEIKINGIDYTYNKFLRRHAYISKDEYINNRCYLEMLSRLNTIILKNKK